MKNETKTSSRRSALARLIALYLPQFHPIPENNEWWGEGFTEWSNTARARPLFRGHQQPNIPADLGFYDLRLSEVREAQAEIARKYGIEGFCYYHYWFGGKRLLERPFNEVLYSGKPDFPFCLCWANETWSGVWHGNPGKILIEQTYPGHDDYVVHFNEVLKAFKDKRYITVDEKPLFLIYKPTLIPKIRVFTDLWRDLVKKEGLRGLYLIGMNRNKDEDEKEYGLDAFIFPNLIQKPKVSNGIEELYNKIIRKYNHLTGRPKIVSYEKIVLDLVENKHSGVKSYPFLLPNWDNTPRCGKDGIVLHGSTPELFRKQVKKVFNIVRSEPSEHRLIFLKSWNEWAEGNYLEPDLRFGRGYLQVIAEELSVLQE